MFLLGKSAIPIFLYEMTVKSFENLPGTFFEDSDCSSSACDFVPTTFILHLLWEVLELWNFPTCLLAAFKFSHFFSR